MKTKTHPKTQYIYVGVDSHKLTHTATIINCFNEKLGAITFKNNYKGFASLTKLANQVGDDTPAIYGLEDTKQYGYLLKNFLMKNGLIVKHINYSETAAERRKYPVSIKNDNLDSSCIAKVTLDNFDKLQDAQDDEIYWTLKQFTVMRETLTNSSARFKRKLHNQLMFNYPNYYDLFTDISCKSAIRFWEKYPSPDLLKNVTDEELFNFFKEDSNSLWTSRINKIIENVRKIDLNNFVYQENRNIIIKMTIKQIKENILMREDLEWEMIKIYDIIGKKLHTFPGMNKILASYILAEIGNIDRFATSSKLAKYAGIAPIDYSSGNSSKAYANKCGNRKLNMRIYIIAFSCLGRGSGTFPMNPIFAEYYLKKISEGKTKHQALICVMRRIINIIYNILKNNTEYKIPVQLLEECKTKFLKRQQEQEDTAEKIMNRIASREILKNAGKNV